MCLALSEALMENRAFCCFYECASTFVSEKGKAHEFVSSFYIQHQIFSTVLQPSGVC